MSASPSPPSRSPAVEHQAEGRALAQILRALEAQPGCAALCAPRERVSAAFAALARRPGSQLRTIAVRGGGLDPDAFCAQLLRALHAQECDRPRAVFEAYLAHLHSLGSHLVLLVEGADALEPATLECVARWLRGPASALRLVAAGADQAALSRVVDLFGTRGSLVQLGAEADEEGTEEPGAEADEEGTEEPGARVEPQQAATPPETGVAAAPAPVAQRRWRIAWPLRAAGLAVVVTSALLWSQLGDETQPPAPIGETTPSAAAASVEPDPDEGPGGGDLAALDGSRPALASADAIRLEVTREGGLRLDTPGTSPAAPARPAPLEAVLVALEAGDSDAYKRALRRIDGPAAVQAEAELVRRLEEPPRSDGVRDRSGRMLAAWGLALVGGRDSLAPLAVAAVDADPNVAALAARSAGVIRARLARDTSEPGTP